MRNDQILIQFTDDVIIAVPCNPDRATQLGGRGGEPVKVKTSFYNECQKVMNNLWRIEFDSEIVAHIGFTFLLPQESPVHVFRPGMNCGHFDEC